MAKGLSRSLRLQGSLRSGVSSIGVWAASYPVVCGAMTMCDDSGHAISFLFAYR